MPRYFAFKQYSSSNPKSEFIFQIDDEKMIQRALDILSGKEKTYIRVGGWIRKQKMSYNPNFKFHLAPDMIVFFEHSIEYLDANMEYINEYLDEVGTVFCAGGRWDPADSYLTREVKL